MSILSNNNNNSIDTVPIAATTLTSFCALALLPKALEIALNNNNPITPPKVFVMTSVTSKAPILKIN
ncbi:hypothetical protein SAE01_36830 [Segetibacter aerophilus]|uniref:Uncharacterized protein n=1 Tax=Segetibacter aerophilus TaxID=670293 RepID=A0A512BH97_9BACT|nr:hypothetical protein SAE01_36830 [Segetibacter aerophilus]